MQRHVLICDVCEATTDADALNGMEKVARSWYVATVARADGWHPQDNPTGDSWLSYGYPDAWPGMSRWETNVWPPQNVRLDLCSEECAFEAMRKLHDGAKIVRFEGSHQLTAQELSFILHYRANSKDSAPVGVAPPTDASFPSVSEGAATPDAAGAEDA